MMNKMQFSGFFSIQDFFITHRQLLIRSTIIRDDGMPWNTDLIFKGVFYLEVPGYFEGEFQIEEANEYEIAYVKEKVGINIEKVFAIRIGNQNYLIGAGSMKVQKNTLLPDESSIERW